MCDKCKELERRIEQLERFVKKILQKMQLDHIYRFKN